MKIRRIKDVKEPSAKMEKKKTEKNKPENKKTEKKKKRRRKALRLVMNLLVTALFAVTLTYAALSPFFDIKEITVKESEHYDRGTLMEASGISPGLNGFRLLFTGPGRFYLLHIGEAEKQILEKCPYVKEADVRYLPPSKAIIEVTERTPSVIIQTKTASFLADKEGYLLETGADPKKQKLPVIRVPEPKSPALGKKLGIPEENLSTAYELYDTIREVDDANSDKLLPLVDYVDVSDLGNVRFSLQDRITVNLGKLTDLHYKINATVTIFKKSLKNTDRGMLDFSTDSDPVFTPENGG